MRQYLDLMRYVLEHGAEKGDRTGTGTLSTFGWQMRFDLARGFPLVTTKKLHMRSIIHELLWFLRGDTNIAYLHEHDVTIWDEWADDAGELGPVYGRQWRSWPTPDGRSVDQIADLIDEIKRNPDSRRLIVSAWNVADVDRMALPPCHCLFQFWVGPPRTGSSASPGRHRASDAGRGRGRPGSQGDIAPRLSCQLYQRSADIFLGVPFNIASYSLLTMMIAQATGYEPGEFIHTFGDAHLYKNHLEQAREQLLRETRELPTMRINPDVGSIFDFTFDDFTLENYHPHPRIAAPIAV